MSQKVVTEKFREQDEKITQLTEQLQILLKKI